MTPLSREQQIKFMEEAKQRREQYRARWSKDSTLQDELDKRTEDPE